VSKGVVEDFQMTGSSIKKQSCR